MCSIFGEASGLTCHDQRDGYSSVSNGDLQYGCCVLYPSSLAPDIRGHLRYTKTVMGRGLTFAVFDGVLIGSTHLESWISPEQDGSRERLKQVKEVKQVSGSELRAPIK